MPVKSFARFGAAVLISALLPAALAAQPKPAEAGKGAEPGKEKAAEIPPPVVAVTKHKGVFGGKAISYTATTGETYLTDEKGKPTAAIFSTAYVKDGREPGRPITFLYNGGPGSGSLWLHMGAFGPKRVVVPNDGRDDGAPPYPIVANPHSLLDVTDIVFIDPVGTGFSRALGETDPKIFWGVTADAKSINQFIRRWLDANDRWNSPKYIGGESYGTTRTAALVRELEGSYNDVGLNGLILISTVLDFALGSEAEGNELVHVTNLPSMAATAWYHGKVPDRPENLPAFVEEARQWAIGPYLTALAKGQKLPAAERAQIRAQLARYTGLSEAFLERADLRVVPGRFYKELLRDRGLTVGRLDARYTGKDYDSAGEKPDNDPSFYGIDAAYTAAMNAYAREELKFSPPRDYVSIGGVRDWDWRIGGRDANAYLNVAPYIGRALRENSGLRVFVGQGWYDFATPFFAAEYSLSRTGIPQDRIRYEYYDSGHMMYVREADLVKLSNDVRSFIREGTTGR
ncbi:peptidase S10 [Sandaracinobacter sp. RS1-74]|uniref:S10 family peptidase n=1 Tax=Sandaracinobacteroides sayramensis TaxID=2913411 RepID=UPI001EDB1505|nr:peptidase S10 [Sandaracinobacteroides sayramensis]MCG2839836.1 peptidase S10 [Sandaracinobacteroides sayramensis]